MVEYYLTTETSYPELATAHNIKNPATICRWVQDFHEHGLDGLRKKPKGRVPKIKNADNISKNPEKSTGKQTQDDYIKELEAELAETKQELLYAEIENKYLKELRKLRLKREQREHQILRNNKNYPRLPRSRKGNCHDNSVMENFFGLLKQEIYYGNTFYSYDELKNAIENWIEYYNTKRTKAKLGYLSPVEFRCRHYEQKMIA